MKRVTLFSLLLFLVGAWALVSPDASPAARRLAASAAPPVQGINPKTGQRIPHAPPQPGEVRQMAIRQLGNFSYDPAHGGGIPPDVRRLNGMTVRLSGYMLASQQAGDRVIHFALVPSLFACCYGQPPGVQHIIMVRCAPDHPAAYSSNPVTVQGRLTVSEVRDQGYVVSLFQVAATQVSPGS